PLEFAEFRAETGGIGQSYTVSLIAPSSGMDVLMPGRTVTVEARIPNLAAGVTLPATAVTTAADGTFHVVAVEGRGEGLVARHLPVRVSSQNGTSFAVEGIAPQTEVVTVGAHLLDDGQAVKRFTGLTVEGS
ncbi:MAG: efflux RND transporter periplasmic adaptor subunit, partial [Pseudomonadota bacterium]